MESRWVSYGRKKKAMGERFKRREGGKRGRKKGVYWPGGGAAACKLPVYVSGL